MSVVFYGYGQSAYASELPYGGGRAEVGSPAQVTMVINKQANHRMQVQQIIKAMPVVSAQVLQRVVDHLASDWVQVDQHVLDREAPNHTQVLQQIIDHEANLHGQVELHVATSASVPAQVAQNTGEQVPNNTQVQGIINKMPATPAQVAQELANNLVVSNTQVNMIRRTSASMRGQVLQQIIAHQGALHWSVLNDKLAHRMIAGYCQEPYCGTSYGAYRMGAFAHMQLEQFNKYQARMPVQVEGVLKRDSDRHAQVSMHIVDKLVANHSQVLMRMVDRTKVMPAQVEQIIEEALSEHTQVRLVINKQEALHGQTLLLRGSRTPTQVTQVIYNTRRLRFMDRFPSRGTPALLGQNWSSMPVQTNPDFSVNNINTDVPEQVFRSPAGTSSFVSLTCDTGLEQGVFVDTLAILNHNLTKGAVVSLQGSNDGFATVGFDTPLQVTTNAMYYIAPALPNRGYRYWRINIIDANNPDTYVQIGIVVFGSSRIFTMAENFVQPITAGLKDFKDTMPTEGYTNAANDRALRRFLRLQFQDLAYNRNNFKQLDEVFKSARTSTKVLWIPTPQTPERYTVFAKLTELPELSVTSNEEDGGTDYLTLSINLDESL